MDPLARKAARLLGQRIVRAERLHGGDLSVVLRLALADGRLVVAKSGPAPRSEAAMLRAIADTGAPAPPVLAVDDSVLVLADMPESPATEAGWSDLGSQLKILHAHSAPHYGWDRDYAFAALPIDNRICGNWTTFWAERRLRPALQALPLALASRLERIAGRLSEWLPEQPRASLLHGDLWSGNVMFHGNRLSALIDPACYFGHGEVDLAMLCLFGRPPPAFWSSYGTPAGNWPVRCALYQLWPALVHVQLFGGGYLSMISRLLDQIES